MPFSPQCGPQIDTLCDLRVLTFGPSAAIDAIRHGEATPGIHLVRVLNPSPSQRAELEPTGYSYKPQRIEFNLQLPVPTSPTYDSEDYARSLHQPRRTQFRRSVRTTSELLRSRRLVLHQDYGATPRLLGEFVALYRRVIGSKERGCLHLPEEIRLAGGLCDYLARDNFGMYMLSDAVVVAGMVVKRFDDAYSLHYSAVSADAPVRHLQLFLIWQLIQRSIHSGFETLNYGSDTNLYGHHLNTGLLQYKLSLGFEPRALPARELLKIVQYSVFTFPLVFFALAKDDSLYCSVVHAESHSRMSGLSQLSCPVTHLQLKNGYLEPAQQ